METLVVSPQEYLEIYKASFELGKCLVFKGDDLFGVWSRAESKWVEFIVKNFNCKPYHPYKVIVRRDEPQA
jgi:hypothetical protein